MRMARIKRALKILFGPKGGPTLEITTIFPCVNRCRDCPQDAWRRAYTGKARLTFAEFQLLLKKIPKRVRLDFSGFSEPFANPEASLMMRHAVEQGYRVALFTTLVGFKSRDLDRLRGLHIYPCAVHLPDDTNFKVPDEDRWLETFRLFSRHIPYDEAVYHSGTVSATIRQAVQTEKVQVRPLYSRANNADQTIVDRLPRQTGPISCKTSGNRFDQNVMMPNGDVYLCCMDWSLQHCLGNLFEASYEQLHQGDLYKTICNSMQDESIEVICRYCARCKDK
ncbi:MAG: SPASM domain-containing protein [Desulfuromonadaceae bacterium]